MSFHLIYSTSKSHGKGQRYSSFTKSALNHRSLTLDYQSQRIKSIVGLSCLSIYDRDFGSGQLQTLMSY